jgi:hypothetical protein
MIEEVTKFILRYFDSVEQFDVFIFLAGHPQKQWTPEEVSRELRSNPASIAKRLADLSLHGLLTLKLEPVFSYVFDPADEAVKRVTENLLDCHTQYRKRIIELICSKPADKITIFAEAFRFKEKPHG